jgi:hypothetical protein
MVILEENNMKISLEYCISYAIEIPCSEKEDDRAIWMFSIIASDEFESILESFTIFHCFTFHFSLFTFHCGDEPLYRHPFHIFLLVSGEVDIRDDEHISIRE